MALHMAGRDAEAVSPLEGALRLQPDLAPAALFLGASRMRLGRARRRCPRCRRRCGCSPTAARRDPSSRRPSSLSAANAQLWWNHSAGERHWLDVRLVGTRSNRHGNVSADPVLTVREPLP